ncbi:33626_t:CDS:2, partial [Gigaspora margarita]
SLFRTSSGRISANQQEEFEHLSNFQQSESVSFVTARSSSDPLPIYEEAVQTVQQEVQQEDGIELLCQTVLDYETRLNNYQRNADNYKNRINSLENINQTLIKNIKDFKETIIYIWRTQNVHQINIHLLSQQVEVEIRKDLFNNHLELIQKQFFEFIESIKYKN